MGQAPLVLRAAPPPPGTFSDVTHQVPAYARSTARLCQALVAAVVGSGRAASEVARAHRVSWWLVQTTLIVILTCRGILQYFFS
ncbi:Helix-turn-helix domain of transposase family ISL3 [Modestobacter sp. DSM 44400]|uniref:helix-turn-helix domain-containing protein n=1 Tax=Modestobacter sp. DSM 44400 TaxID=1550230 RepID=UPI000897E736|nr:helix-turn-helix domain-containing protein [Modestobacter sp. DSM 44400]SDY89057.1 Helix-turn-helix domain of transposase family ISL3 [Modestobacter sp. DSM 44400]